MTLEELSDKLQQHFVANPDHMPAERSCCRELESIRKQYRRERREVIKAAQPESMKAKLVYLNLVTETFWRGGSL